MSDLPNVLTTRLSFVHDKFESSHLGGDVLCVSARFGVNGLCCFGFWLHGRRPLVGSASRHSSTVSSGIVAEKPDSQATGDHLISVFWSADTKPAIIPNDFLAFPPGIHEWSDEYADAFSECVIAVVDGADGRRYVYVYDSSQLESEVAEEQRLVVMLVTGLFIALLVCLLLLP